MNGVQLYFRLIQISLLARLQYRVNFLVGLLGLLAWNLVNLGLLSVLVTQFKGLKGWTLWELVFLYSLWILAHSLYSLFFSQTSRLEEHLIEGTFDQFLLRPVSPLIQLLGRELQYLEIADALIGLAGLGLAYVQLGLSWTGWQWSFFLVAVVCGALIELALNLLVACSAFWTGRSRGSFFVLEQFYGLVHQYPVDIFGNAFRVLVTGLIPVAFMNYYPTLILLDRPDRAGAGGWLGYLTPLVALALLGLVAGVWRLALRQYTSSGS